MLASRPLDLIDLDRLATSHGAMVDTLMDSSDLGKGSFLANYRRRHRVGLEAIPASRLREEDGLRQEVNLVERVVKALTIGARLEVPSDCIAVQREQPKESCSRYCEACRVEHQFEGQDASSHPDLR